MNFVSSGRNGGRSLSCRPLLDHFLALMQRCICGRRNDAAQNVIGDFAVQCPTRAAALLLSAQGHDVFLYDFKHQPAESVNWPTGTQNLGAFHGAEVRLEFPLILRIAPCDIWGSLSGVALGRCRSCSTTGSSSWAANRTSPTRCPRTGPTWPHPATRTPGLAPQLDLRYQQMQQPRALGMRTALLKSWKAHAASFSLVHTRRRTPAQFVLPTPLSGGTTQALTVTLACSSMDTARA